MRDHKGLLYEARLLSCMRDESLTLWNIFRKHMDTMVADPNRMESAHEMCDYFNRLNENFLRFYSVYIEGRIVGAVYFYNYNNVKQSVSIAGIAEPRIGCIKTYAKLIRACCVSILTHEDIQRIEAKGRYDNRAIRLFNSLVGFKMEGRLRSYKPHGGIFKDYYVASMIGGDNGRR